MSDSLFEIYQNVESSKELWDSLIAKYMAEDASSKKFPVSNFTNYKMIDSRSVMEQYDELLGILRWFTQHKMNMYEAIHISCINDKPLPSWKDFKHTLKHQKEELNLVELGSHLRIKESPRMQDGDKPRSNNVVGPSVVNMMEHNNSSRYTKNKGKCKHQNTKADPNKKAKVTCPKCEKPGHLKRFAKVEKLVDLTKEFLPSMFSMKEIGEADVIISIRIKHESNEIAISHSHYIEKGLKKFNYFDCTPVSTSMDTMDTAYESSWIRRIGLYIFVVASEFKAQIRSSAAGTDNRPPMLEESDFESWKIRIESQGLPRHIFNTLNQTKTAKEIWENVKLLMQGSGLTKQQQKETMFGQYERFRANGNESIHDYFVRFHNLINDMKITNIEIPVHQRNTKFRVFDGELRVIKGNRLPLDLKSRTCGKAMQGEKSAKDSQWFKDKALCMEAKEKGVVLDAEAEAFLADVECTAPYAEPLAIPTTTTFEVSHEDAYDSDVDEGLHAVAAFMANLKQTSPSTGQGTSNDTDFRSENFFFFLHLSSSWIPYDLCCDARDDLNMWYQEPRSNCVKEHSKNLELEAEILKVKQLLVEKEKRCSFIETEYQGLELKFQKYKACFKNPQVCNNSSSPELNVSFEINKLKDQLQGKDDLIWKLKAKISNMKEVSAGPNLSTLKFQALETKNTQLKEELTTIRIKNDSLRDENVSIKKCYQDLYKSKAENNSNVSSGAVVPEKPKVLAPGLYAMTTKYVPPQKTNNREVNTPLPRNEKVSSVKNPNVPAYMSTGINFITEASKSKSKCEMKTHRNLPARSENVKKKCGYSKDNCELNFKFLNNLQPEWKRYSTMMRQNKNLMDINIDALYNILKQNQGDVTDAMGLKKKTGVVTLDPLALIAEKMKVSKRKEKVVLSLDSEGSDADDFSELKKITAFLPTRNKSLSSRMTRKLKRKMMRKSDMSKVKCYNCKKEGHFVKDCKKVKVKDYEYYKIKMLLAKKDKDEQVLLAEDQVWMESSSDSDQEINANMVFMAQIKKVLSDSEASSSSADNKIYEVSYYLSKSKSESEYETSEYYDNTTTYGLFVNDNDDQEIFHDCENLLENLIES
nr:zinc finger, CCHC-type [Tanacetum cinerariifolium]